MQSRRDRNCHKGILSVVFTEKRREAKSVKNRVSRSGNTLTHPEKRSGTCASRDSVKRKNEREMKRGDEVEK